MAAREYPVFLTYRELETILMLLDAIPGTALEKKLTQTWKAAYQLEPLEDLDGS